MGPTVRRCLFEGCAWEHVESLPPPPRTLPCELPAETLFRARRRDRQYDQAVVRWFQEAEQRQEPTEA